MRYQVDGTDEIFDLIQDVLDYCFDEDYHRDDHDAIEQYVNENWGDITIGGETFYAYDIVRNLGDLDSFIDDYCENENDRDKEDAEYELENAEIGDTIYFQGNTIRVISGETGDFDGDEQFSCDNLEDLRTKLNEIKTQREEEKRNEAEIENKMLQIIGG